jgi:hypothetical protein
MNEQEGGPCPRLKFSSHSTFKQQLNQSSLAGEEGGLTPLLRRKEISSRLTTEFNLIPCKELPHMARKWSHLNLPGALHYVTGNFLDRATVF